MTKKAITVTQEFLLDQIRNTDDAVEKIRIRMLVDDLQEWKDWITEPDDLRHCDAAGIEAVWRDESGNMGVQVEPDKVTVWVKPGHTRTVHWSDEDSGDIMMVITPCNPK